MLNLIKEQKNEWMHRKVFIIGESKSTWSHKILVVTELKNEDGSIASNREERYKANITIDQFGEYRIEKAITPYSNKNKKS